MNVEFAISYTGPACFFPISGLVAPVVQLKAEAFNVAASIKMKPALRMIDDLERSGRLCPGGALIESSSGNLGIAVACVAASRGYRFICVTDPNASEQSVKAMRAVGSEVIIVDQKDANNGYLGSRIALIQRMCKADSHIVWINQYANESNWRAHFDTTAPEILDRFEKVDYLFVGTGTTGTLMGCARYFRKFSRATRIIAVEPVGSVTFGTPSQPRHIPGIGTSRRPELLDEALVDSVVYVSELKTIRVCRELAACGLLVGGSTGSALAAIKSFGDKLKVEDTVVTIMPDLGFKYIDTIFSDEWLGRHYGSAIEKPDDKVGVP